MAPIPLTKAQLLKARWVSKEIEQAGQEYKNAPARLSERKLLKKLYRIYYFAQKRNVADRLAKNLVKSHNLSCEPVLDKALVEAAIGQVGPKKLSDWTLVLRRAWGHVDKPAPGYFLIELENAGGLKQAVSKWKPKQVVSKKKRKKRTHP